MASTHEAPAFNRQVADAVGAALALACAKEMDTAPPAVLAMQARSGSPIAVLQRCVEMGRLRLVRAFRAVLEAAIEVSEDPVELLLAAADLANTIADESARGRALVSVVEQMLSIDPDDQSSIDATHRFVLAMEPAVQSQALCAVAKAMAARAPNDPMAIDRAVAVLDRFRGERHHAEALADLGTAIFDTDRANAERVFVTAMDAANDEPSPGAAARWVVQMVLDCDAAVGTSLFTRAFSDPTLPGGDETRRELISGRLLRDRRLLVNLDDAISADVISLAVALAESNESRADQAAQLASLAGHWRQRDSVLSDNLFEQAIELAVAVDDGVDRDRGLASIIEAMSCASDLSLDLLDQAEVLLSRMDNESWQRDCALQSIARGLVRLDPADPALIERAFATLRNVVEMLHTHDEAIRDIALLIGRADPANPDTAEWAIETARNELPGGDDYLNDVRWELAVSLFAAEPTIDMASRAAAIISDISSDSCADLARAGLALAVAAAGPSNELSIDFSLRVVDSMADVERRMHALAEVAEVVFAHDPVRGRDLLATAAAMNEPLRGTLRMAAALAAVASAVSQDAPDTADRLFEHALQLADEPHRDAALGAIARGLAASSGPSRESAFEDAITVAAMVGSRWAEHVVDDIAATTAQSISSGAESDATVARVVAAGALITETSDRRKLLAGAAASLFGRDPDASVRLFAHAEELKHQASHLDPCVDAPPAAMAKAIVAKGPSDTTMIARAVAIADTLELDGERARLMAALTAVVMASEESLGRPMVMQTRALAANLEGDSAAAEALAVLGVACFGADRRLSDVLFDEALSATDSIEPDHFRWQAVIGVAAAVAGTAPSDAEAASRAREFAESIEDGHQRDRAIRRIAIEFVRAAPRDPVVAEQAIATAQTIAGESERSRALGTIAAVLAGPDLSRAIAIASDLPLGWTRDRVLADIVASIADATHVDDTATAAALGVIESISEYRREACRASAVLGGRLGRADLVIDALDTRHMSPDEVFGVVESLVATLARHRPDAAVAVASAMASCLEPFVQGSVE